MAKSEDDDSYFVYLVHRIKALRKRASAGYRCVVALPFEARHLKQQPIAVHSSSARKRQQSADKEKKTHKQNYITQVSSNKYWPIPTNLRNTLSGLVSG